MPPFSVTDEETKQKIKIIFQKNSSNGISLNQKQILKFSFELGLNNDMFLNDLIYYYPEIEQKKGLTFLQILKFLDFILTNKKTQQQKIEAFKCLDKHGSGQINTADLLLVLKKKLNKKDYEMFSQLISSSYGPLINYMEILNKSKKQK